MLKRRTVAAKLNKFEYQQKVETIKQDVLQVRWDGQRHSTTALPSDGNDNATNQRVNDKRDRETSPKGPRINQKENTITEETIPRYVKFS